MAKIIQMTPQLANLIAAGEVVERPGSVVKELIENAVDAEARHITVEIKNGGVSYIRVTDDGTGILPDDVRTAFLRHATSKLYTEKQLSSIGTLGFRGEALSSVAAVSKMDVFTRTKRFDAGIQISVEAGEETYYGDTGCPVGTTVVVRELFFNVPARAKFLKKDATEAAYAENAVVQTAMAHPEIVFHFIKDGRETFRTSGDGKLLNVLRVYCGGDVAGRLRAVAGAGGEIAIEGYVSPPELNRANRNQQSFFINGRPMRARILTAAVEQAYKGRMTGGRFPLCFLGLRIPPAAVDVNVHPAKLEVKFAREKEIFSAVYYAVQTALEAGERISALKREAAKPPEDYVTVQQQTLLDKPERKPVYTYRETFAAALAPVAEGGEGIPYQIKQKPSQDVPVQEPPSVFVKPILDMPASSVKETADISFIETVAVEHAPDVTEEPPCPNAEKKTLTEEPGPKDDKNQEIPSVRVLGELFHTYLLAEDQDGVWLIDKHAAREKQIYNEIKDCDAGTAGQLLLEPMTIMLSAVEKATCIEYRDLLGKAGFELEDFGAGGLRLRQVPMYLGASDVSAVLSDVAQQLMDRKTPESEALDALYKSVACKAAVKAGMKTDVCELQRFAETVMADPAVRNCPHGRPAVVFVPKTQLEKLFKRII